MRRVQHNISLLGGKYHIESHGLNTQNMRLVTLLTPLKIYVQDDFHSIRIDLVIVLLFSLTYHYLVEHVNPFYR